MSENVFWANALAKQIRDRNSFFFTKKPLPKVKKWSVKSSSSLSGVLHIGRLSDLIRTEAVSRALEKQKVKKDFIYVTEDMDPLRSIPKGVPKKFEQFIGMPVSDVPDPFGCHKSYAEHFVSDFLKVIDQFLFSKPKVFSMRKEYKNGSFNDSIKILVKNADRVREIIESKQDSRLPENWSPWKPICEKCGKLQTTTVEKLEGLKIHYVCRDYNFEKHVAKGCGFQGESDLRKANGKLVWKSEWAAQWEHWNVCSEGAGKEYESKNSAYWVNAEICERVLEFPMPVPIFYEHLTVDGKKMSASKGNVVYPRDWLLVSRPEVLKYLYMKRIMKSRSFSWKDIPDLELELDRAILSKDNELVEYSRVNGRELVSVPVDYLTVASLVQLFSSERELLERISSMGIVSKKISSGEKAALLERIEKARKWIENYAPTQFRLSFLEKTNKETLNQISPGAKNLFPAIAEKIAKSKNPEQVQQAVFSVAKENNVSPKEAFKSIYLVLTGKDSGPRVGLLVFALGKEKSVKRLKEIA